MSRIFISYATRDGSDTALQLVTALEAAGRRCWIGPRDVTAGVEYPGQIVSAIRGSDGLVLLLTAGANESHDVLQEVHCAHNEGKLIVPLVIRGTRASDSLSYFLGVRQQIAWADAKTTAGVLTGLFGSTGRTGRSEEQGQVVSQCTNLFITRPPQYADALRAYTIHIDGAKVGAIRRDERLQFSIPVGDHQLKLTIDWASSNTLCFKAVAGEDVHLECGNNGKIISVNEYLFVSRVVG
jgi:hypothetical protein